MMPATVELPSPLFAARFVHRPNRFVVHARLERREGVELPDGVSPGRKVVCHMADPGRLRELLLPERSLLLRYAPAPHRKTDWSLVLVRAPQGRAWVSVDTTLPNRLVGVALEQDALEEFHGWSLERREFTHGRSRFDFLLARGEERMVVEVKSVTLVDGEEALFPDAVTARGKRHVEELTELVRRPGWDAAVLFVLQRDDAGRIRAARDIDPAFAGALAEARDAGVRVLGRRCHVDPERVIMGERVQAE